MELGFVLAAPRLLDYSAGDLFLGSPMPNGVGEGLQTKSFGALQNIR